MDPAGEQTHEQLCFCFLEGFTFTAVHSDSESDSKNCVRTTQQSALSAHPVYQIHIMNKSTLKPFSQGN